ncbi:hypothetical protein ACJX0J_024487, partial [Zea mays]
MRFYLLFNEKSQVGTRMLAVPSDKNLEKVDVVFAKNTLFFFRHATSFSAHASLMYDMINCWLGSLFIDIYGLCIV